MFHSDSPSILFVNIPYQYSHTLPITCILNPDSECSLHQILHPRSGFYSTLKLFHSRLQSWKLHCFLIVDSRECTDLFTNILDACQSLFGSIISVSVVMITLGLTMRMWRTVTTISPSWNKCRPYLAISAVQRSSTMYPMGSAGILGCRVNRYTELFSVLWRGLSLNDFLQLYWYQVNLREQQDAVEFFMTLIDNVDEALKSLGHEQACSKVLGGLISDQKNCKTCPHR